MRGEWRSRKDQLFRRKSTRNASNGPGGNTPSDKPRESEEVVGVIEPVFDIAKPRVRVPQGGGIKGVKEPKVTELTFENAVKALVLFNHDVLKEYGNG